MKKAMLAVMTAFLVFGGVESAYSQKAKGDEAKKGSVKKEQKVNKDTKKILVVYYSYSGNTKEVATQIQNKLKADIFEIQTVDTYPSVYKELTDKAKEELNAGYQPPIKGKVANIGDYDVVFVGSPNWWSTIAPAVITFLSQHDLSGKTIIPFITHGGSALGKSVNDVKKYAPASTVTDAKAFYGSSVNSSDSKKDVSDWLDGIKAVK